MNERKRIEDLERAATRRKAAQPAATTFNYILYKKLFTGEALTEAEQLELDRSPAVEELQSTAPPGFDYGKYKDLFEPKNVTVSGEENA